MPIACDYYTKHHMKATCTGFMSCILCKMISPTAFLEITLGNPAAPAAHASCAGTCWHLHFKECGNTAILQLPAAQTAVLFVRPRGWHLLEKHMHVDRQPVPAAIFDFALFFFHNAKELLKRGSGELAALLFSC